MARRPATASLAQRLVVAATALMPASRRGWGRAITAELACTTSPAEQARLVLAAVRIVLLSPPGCCAGLREYARTAGRSAVLALIAYIPIGLVLYLLTVVFPAAQVATPAVFGYGYPLAVLLTAGARARRASARIGAPSVAGLAAGLVLAILAVATVAVLDNAFLSVISQQPDNIAKFRASGMTSMRAYLNGDLESITPVVTLILAIAGAVFAPLGAALAKALAAATAETPARLHRIPGSYRHDPPPVDRPR
jgi:hypothetical protein